MSALQIPTAEVFAPLLDPARYKGAKGGRGSGKSHFFAEMLMDDHLRIPGLRSVCIREIQKSLKESAKRLIEDKIQQHGVGSYFSIRDDKIITPGDGLIIFQGMQDHTAESIKSLEGFQRAWCEEAQTISSRSLKLLRPTIRAENSELWFSWNPTMPTDPVDKMFCQGEPPTGSVVVTANWRDNPWFPSVLEQERLDCLTDDPEQYDHIWEGDYVSVVEGSYFAKYLKEARNDGRIGRVPRDPLRTVHLYADLGGTSRTSDAFTFWAVQFVRKEIRLINYYEAVGQGIEDHVFWLHENKYYPNNSHIHLPHDGTTNDRVMPVTFESSFRDAGYSVSVLKNQGAGAAMGRIRAVRRLFKFMYFNEAACAAGIKALGWYHEKIDEARGIGLGPDHDWSSHCADAIGLMAVSYTEPRGHNTADMTPPETADY